MIQDPNNPFLCPHCRRRFQLGAERCIWCGASLRDVETPPLELDCPACGQRLVEQADQDMRIYVCPDCQGVWMNMSMIRKLESLYAQTQSASAAGAGPPPPPHRPPHTNHHTKNNTTRLRNRTVKGELSSDLCC